MRDYTLNIQPLLLTDREAARLLGMGRTTFRQRRDDLVDQGMKVVRMGRSVRYERSSIEKLVRRAVERGKPIIGTQEKS